MSYYEPYRDVTGKAAVLDSVDCVAVPHFHRAIEYIFVLEGKAKITTCNFEKEFSAGEIAFIASYHAHSLYPIGHCRTRTIMLPSSYYERAKQRSDLVFFALDDEEFNKKLFAISDEIKSASKSSDDLIFLGYIDVLLGLTIERYPPLNPNEKHVTLITEIIKYLDDNFTEQLTLDSVAAKFGFSKYYFSRLFHRFFACNFTVYLNRLRVRFIENHLTDNVNLTEVILSAGFNQTSTYYQFLKRENGRSLGHD